MNLLKNISTTILTCLILSSYSQNKLASTNYSQDSIINSSYPTKINNKLLLKSITLQAGFLISGMAYLQYIWYKDVPRTSFTFYDDSRGYLQMDKFGHAFGSYLESSISYHSLRNAGLSKNKSVLIGGSMGLILQTPIEIWDGLYEGWGFSWSDMIANAAGSALFSVQEIAFDKQIIKYKFSYAPSKYAPLSNGMLGNSFMSSLFLDYNGHTYWLAFPIPGNKNSKITKLINISIGYSANGMFGEFENSTSYEGVHIPETFRYRQYLLSLDIDWSQIKTNSKALKIIFKGLKFIKIPFPTIEYNSLNKFKMYPIY